MNAELYDQSLDHYNDLAASVDLMETDQARALASLMMDKLRPNSVIDLGCSSGIYLLPFLEMGFEVHGVDGASGVGKWIPGHFEVFDLRQPYFPAHKFDLCYCIETIEHIRPKFTETVVESVSRCSDTIFVSVARPGQGGEGHTAEMDKDRVLGFFSKFGIGLHPRNAEVMAVINTDPVYDKVHWLRWNGMLLGK